MKKFVRFSIVVLVYIIALSQLSCTEKGNADATSPDPAFTEYISSFTGGVIPRKSSIIIELAHARHDTAQTAEVKDKLITVKPHIQGKLRWIDSRTLAFVPDRPLNTGTKYTVTVNLGRIIDVPNRFKTFTYEVRTSEQSFSVNELALKTYTADNTPVQYLTGKVYTADYAQKEDVEEIIKVRFNNKETTLLWEHDANGTSHTFRADSLARTDKPGKLTVSWDGKPLAVDKKGEEKLELPALGDFKITQVKAVLDDNPYVLISFTDPIDGEQDLNGLITITNAGTLRFLVQDNEVKVYTPARLTGEQEINIHYGVRNLFNKKLQQPLKMNIFFEDVKPALRSIGKGNIMPQSREMIFPFEAVNLKAVDVRIIKILSFNSHQFFQANNYGESYDLKRVARLVASQRTNLQAATFADLKNWNTYSIDIAKLIDLEPGSIYRVELRFRKEYSLWGQTEADSPDPTILGETSDDDFDETATGEWWDAPGWYSEYYYPRDYEWSERDNPDHVSYFNNDRFISRNLFATNMGIIAKGGDDMTISFAVTNLKTTQPISGVTLNIYNFQKQLIESAATDSRGMAKVKLAGKPFLLVAEKDGQTAYLRLDHGSSLSLSNFDVSGDVVQKGLKGYIYGERGVWRPGDRIYLSFILEDKQDNIPGNHPVILELLNPQNQVVNRQVQTKGTNGFYCFTAETDDNAPTGNWTARVKVGGVTFSKRVKVETIKPNRLKIDLAFSEAGGMLKQGIVPAQLTAAWLHGGTARNLDARVSLALSKKQTSFKDYYGYVFDDPAKNDANPNEQEIFEAGINEAGTANFNIDMPSIPGAPGMMDAHFTTRVFEKTGDFSIDVKTIPYAPYNSFVGLRLPVSDTGWYKTDEPYKLDIVTLTPEGKPVNRNNLEVTIYKIHWRWWWDADEDYLARYVSGNQRELVLKKTINTTGGKAAMNVEIKYNNWNDNGRYLIHVKDPESGHSTGLTAYFSQWGQWSPEGGQTATILTIKTDKEKYNTGDLITVTMPSSKNGKALVSLETGNSVADMFWVDTKDQSSEFSFVAKPYMAPNIFVHVSLLQPHEQTENDAPIRMYGLAQVAVEDPATHLHPTLTLPGELTPEQEYEVKVSEKTGRDMTYTLAVVDEGLLDLTRFRTPEPWSVFYAREALGVKTWDYYDYVIGAYGARLDRAFAVGGDEALLNSGRQKITRFKPVVDFVGPITLGRNKTNTHKLKMPNYVGSVRVMVVAGNNGSYGNVEQAVKVAQPLMVLATMPRVIGPGEEVKVPVNVFAMKDDVKDVTVTISCNELFTKSGASSRNIRFKETGDQLAGFDLKAAEKTGTGKIIVTAVSGPHKASQEIEIEVRPSNPIVAAIIEKVVEPGQKTVINVEGPGIAGTNSAMLELSGIPNLNIGSRLKELIMYPHGCIEQITSIGFPQLMLPYLLDIDETRKQEIEKNVKAVLGKLTSFQTADGGFAYWPGDRYVSPWGTNYAGHFMLKAEEAGYYIPYGVKEKWMACQQEAARNWKSGSSDYSQEPLIQAYRLYTLALAGNPEFGAMNRLKADAELPLTARWRLAATYAMAGQPEVAESMIAQLSMEVKPYIELAGTYGSDIRDKAMIVETLTAMGRIKEAFPLVNDVAAQLSSTRWMSTQTTAYALVALSMFAGDGYAESDQLKANVSVNNETMKTVTTAKPQWQSDVALKDNKSSAITVENLTNRNIYARTVSRGIPMTGDTITAQNNLILNVIYTDMEGRSIDPANISQGTDFMAQVSVHNPGQRGTYEEMALTVIFPSGWEILNTRINDLQSAVQSDNFNYQDIRDDRVYTYFRLMPNEKKTFRIILNAAYEGRFYLPSVYCEAMYDNTINARKPGKWVKVINR